MSSARPVSEVRRQMDDRIDPNQFIPLSLLTFRCNGHFHTFIGNVSNRPPQIGEPAFPYEPEDDEDDDEEDRFFRLVFESVVSLS